MAACASQSAGGEDIKCKYCGRIFDKDPNPIRCAAHPGLFLERRRDRSLDCIGCDSALNAYCKGKCRTTLQKNIDEKPEVKREWMLIVEYCEAKLRGEDPPLPNIVYIGQIKDREPRVTERPNVTVEASEGRKTRFETCTAVFFNATQYFDAFNEELGKNGTKHPGKGYGKVCKPAVLSNKALTIGTKVYDEYYYQVGKNTEAANKKTELFEDACDLTYTQLADRLGTSVKEVKTGKGDEATTASLLVFNPTKKKKAADGFDQLDDLFYVAQPGKEKDESETGSRRRQSGEGGEGGRRVPNNSNRPSGANKPDKRETEINEVELRTVTLKQSLQQYGRDSTFMIPTGKVIFNLKKRVSAKLTQEFIDLVGRVRDQGDRGYMVLADARQSITQGDKSEPLSDSLHCSNVEAPEFPGTHLLSLANSCKDAQIEIAPAVYELCIEREMKVAHAAKDNDKVVLMLNATKPEACQLDIGCWLVQKEVARFVDLQVVDHTMNLCMSPNSEENVQLLTTWFFKVEQVKITDGTLIVELVEIRELCKILQGPVSSLKTVSDTKAKYKNNDQLRFHKALTLFPTGEGLMDRVGERLAYFALQEQNLLIVVEMETMSMAFLPINQENSIKINRVFLPEAHLRKAHYEKWVSLDKTMDNEFYVEYCLRINAQGKVIENARDDLNILAANHLTLSLKPIFTEYLDLVKVVTEEFAKTLVFDAKLVDEKFPPIARKLDEVEIKNYFPDAIGLNNISTAKTCELFDTFITLKDYAAKFCQYGGNLLKCDYPFQEEGAVKFANYTKYQVAPVNSELIKEMEILISTTTGFIRDSLLIKLVQKLDPHMSEFVGDFCLLTTDEVKEKFKVVPGYIKSFGIVTEKETEKVDTTVMDTLKEINTFSDFVAKNYRKLYTGDEKVKSSSREFLAPIRSWICSPSIFWSLKLIAEAEDVKEVVSLATIHLPRIREQSNDAMSRINILRTAWPNQDDNFKAEVALVNQTRDFVVEKATWIVTTCMDSIDADIKSMVECKTETLEEPAFNLEGMLLSIDDNFANNKDAINAFTSRAKSKRFFELHKTLKPKCEAVRAAEFTTVLEYLSDVERAAWNKRLEELKSQEEEVVFSIACLTCAQVISKPLGLGQRLDKMCHQAKKQFPTELSLLPGAEKLASIINTYATAYEAKMQKEAAPAVAAIAEDDEENDDAPDETMLPKAQKRRASGGTASTTSKRSRKKAAGS